MGWWDSFLYLVHWEQGTEYDWKTRQDVPSRAVLFRPQFVTLSRRGPKHEKLWFQFSLEELVGERAPLISLVSDYQAMGVVHLLSKEFPLTIQTHYHGQVQHFDADKKIIDAVVAHLKAHSARYAVDVWAK